MNNWFDALHKKRRKWVETSRENNFERGIRQSTVDKYADPVHFVYELLQNAEDQEATEAGFTLMADRLIFQHNGNSFTRQDVENITGLGNSAKPEQANKIGRYGIGFKSVFVVTDEPEICTSLEGEPFGFVIQDLVVPRRTAYPKEYIRSDETRFILPFKQDRVDRLYTQIEGKLRTLGADTLLFLRNLKTISWQTPLEGGIYQCDRGQETGICHLIGEAGRKGANKSCEEVRYLVFSEDVYIENADRPLIVQIAFRLGTAGIEAERGSPVLNVYFPTEEKTDLKFRLHAPFLLTDNRANVKRGEPVNEQLIETCARLLVKSLPQIRDRGLLSVSCLNCLPVHREFMDISESAENQRSEEPLFAPVFRAVRDALRHERLLPAANGQFVCASAVKIAGSSELRELLMEDDLTMLFDATTPICWLSADITRDRTPSLYAYLRREIGISVIDPEGFASRITAAFLKKQTDEWMVRFYTFLRDQRALWDLEKQWNPILRTKPVLRLENNTHQAPFKADGQTPNVFLAPQRDTQFPIVKRSIDRDETAHKFFRQLGLREPDILDDVMEFILPRYQKSDAAIPDEVYWADLGQIAQAIESCPRDRRNDLYWKLRRTAFVRAYEAANSDRVQMLTPEMVFLPTEDLTLWFAGWEDVWFLCTNVRDLPSWKTIQSFLDHDREVLRATVPVCPSQQPRGDGYIGFEHRHGCHKRGLQGFTPQAEIKGLEHTLRTITIAKAHILWNLLLEYSHLIKGTVETATHQNFDNVRKTETVVSDIGRLCLERAWLPDHQGGTHQPCELSLSDLPAEFETQSHKARKLVTLLEMRQTELQGVADKLGLPSYILEDLAAAYSEAPQDVAQFLAHLRKPRFPQHEAPNPERRAAKLREEAAEAPPKTYEVRSRSVRTSRTAVSIDKKIDLHVLYTNDAHEMVCQICRQEMPFRLDNGKYYFEAVEFLELLTRELSVNHLALCPTCSAKFSHANGSSPESLCQALLVTDTLEIPIVLAREQQTITFVRDHLEDLRAVIQDTALYNAGLHDFDKAEERLDSDVALP